MASSTATTVFPVITRRAPRIHIPPAVFNFAKYFGSGVIIATAFIHLLEPGVDALSAPCLNENFQNYPFAFAFSMIAAFVTFIVELISFRVGAGLAQKLAYDPHMGGHHHASEHAVPSSNNMRGRSASGSHSITNDGAHPHADGSADIESAAPSDDHTPTKRVLSGKDEKGLSDDDDSVNSFGLSVAASEILGVMILEFGVIFHSVIIGITLGTTDEFVTLFVVIIFHQMFEGLGLGSRLALLPLPRNSWIPYLGAIAYALVTPIGVAIGIGVRNSYNGDSATARYITGTFDSVSSGILFYVGFVELLAHEFVFNERMRKAPIGFVCLSVFEVLLGAGLMALLGRWA